MTGSPDALDAAYRPLGGPETWSAASVDVASWEEGRARLARLADQAPAWFDMVARGAALAAAHQSGVVAGVHGGDRQEAMALLRGVAGPAGLAEPGARVHLAANHRALRSAVDATDTASVPGIRRLHAMACGPQPTYRAHTRTGVEDHVLAHGDYKHHPDHGTTPTGGVRALAPVADVRREMERLAAATAGGSTGLHPVVSAAYALHGLHHIHPFEDGNGRVGRVLAGAHLLRAGTVPFLVFGDEDEPYRDALLRADEGGDPSVLVGFVEGRVAHLVGLVTDLRRASPSSDERAALARWRGRVQAAGALYAALPTAVARALDRHRRRPALAWSSDLAGAVVAMSAPARADGERFLARPLAIRVPVATGTEVDELLAVDAHPLDHDGLSLTADHADLSLEAEPDELLPLTRRFESRLDTWLDRVVMALAVSVAAEAD